MPAARTPMRQVREILRMKHEAGLPVREIVRRTGIPRRTVRELLERCAARGLGWPIAPEVNEAELEGLMFKEAGAKAGGRRRHEPDWRLVHKELKRKHVTLQILWDEYIDQHPEGYRYSRFCEIYREWEAKLSLSMRQTYLGGEKLFVDYAGDTVAVIIDRHTGETRAAHIFVAVIGASSLTYAEATWTEGLADWLGAHTRAFSFIGGSPKLVVPDNPKVAVIKACFYEPMVNRTYEDMLSHYGTAALPARPRKPKDKAKVEAAVRIVERFLLGRLRHRLFYSLAELNVAIQDELKRLNDVFKIRRLGVTRRALFEEVDRPHLTPLPIEDYVYAEWRIRRANLDYHVDIDGSYYSVPFAHARDQIEARVTARTVELFVKGQRVAAHARLGTCGRHTTVPEHMPSSHRRHAGWTPSRIQAEAEAIGPSTALFCRMVLEHKHHPEQGFRACLGAIGEVRELADKMRRALANGDDPATVLSRRDPETMTFRLYAEELIEAKRPHFRNAKHAAQWPSTLKQYAYPSIGDKRIGTITLADIEGILRPIWATKTETAARLRSRIEAVIDYAYVAEGIDRRNPAAFKGNLEHRGFGKRRKISPIVHHPAAPYAMVPAIMSELRQLNTTTALCLRFIILTWVRSSEGRGARWEEIDHQLGLWSIPAERMKAYKSHDVPLSDEASEIIASMRKRTSGTGLVFPGASGGVLSDVGLNKVLHHIPTVARLDAEIKFRPAVRTGRQPKAATVHGMRSSARSWAAAQTEFAPFVAELALAHVNKDKVEAAYQRDRVIEKRRALLQAWGEYCAQPTIVQIDQVRTA